MTLEELEAKISALESRVAAVEEAQSGHPTGYYTLGFSGEELEEKLKTI